jgi:hypothetical protein
LKGRTAKTPTGFAAIAEVYYQAAALMMTNRQRPCREGDAGTQKGLR